MEGWLEPMGVEVVGGQGGGDLQIVILLRKDVTSVVVISDVVGTFNHYKMVKKN